MRGNMPAFDGRSSGDTDWIEPLSDSLAAIWSNYPAEERYGYRRLNGIVYQKGVVRRNTVNGATDAWAFLPVGFRPLITATHGYNQVTLQTNGGAQTVNVRTDGAMFLNSFNPNAGGYIILADMPPFPADG